MIKAVVPLLACLLLLGCSTTKPWVKPYERTHLAEPVMAIDQDTIDQHQMNCTWRRIEGGRGAEAGMGGRCVNP